MLQRTELSPRLDPLNRNFAPLTYSPASFFDLCILKPSRNVLEPLVDLSYLHHSTALQPRSPSSSPCQFTHRGPPLPMFFTENSHSIFSPTPSPCVASSFDRLSFASVSTPIPRLPFVSTLLAGWVSGSSAGFQTRLLRGLLVKKVTHITRPANCKFVPPPFSHCYPPG